MAAVAVDDRDPSVVYSTHWSQLRNNLAYDNTITWTGVAGSTATISFVGTSIGVYGTTFAKDNFTVSLVFLYSIDGGTPTRLTLPGAETGGTLWRQLFFQSPVLSAASHVLTIEYDGDQTTFLFFLDYFMVNEATLPSSSTTTSTSSSSESIPISASTMTTTTSITPRSSLSSTPSSFSTQKSSSSSPTSGAAPGVTTVLVQGKSKSELPIGAIVGGALGAVIFICILLLYLRRRQRAGHSNENIDPPPPIGSERPQIQPSSLISPYDISQPPQNGDKGQPFVSTGAGMSTMKAATSTTRIEQDSSQQASPAATTSSLLVNTRHSSNLVSVSALPSTRPISGGRTNDPPPSYWE